MNRMNTNFNDGKSPRENNINGAQGVLWKRTLEELKNRVDDAAMDKWFYCFSIAKIKRNAFVFRYTGNGDMREFNEKWYEVFAECFFEVLGYRTEIKIEQRKVKGGGKRQYRRRLCRIILALLCVCTAAAVILLDMSYLENLSFEEDFYQVGSGKISGNLRIIQLSDLHSTEFGENNDKLVARIALLQPDIIVATGDMADKSASMDVYIELCRRLTEIAPVYAVYGNNEDDIVYESTMTRDALDKMTGGDPEKLKKSDDTLKAALEDAGATVLLNEQATVEIGDNTIDIYGVLTTNPSAFWEYNTDSYGEFLNGDTDHFKLMLCHEPYIFEEFGEDYWGDLILAGHTHGGVIRIPYLGGLYERKNGFFPEKKDDVDAYIAGEYDMQGTSLIVSRGLTNRGLIRIGNQPELVIIDVNRY